MGRNRRTTTKGGASGRHGWLYGLAAIGGLALIGWLCWSHMHPPESVTLPPTPPLPKPPATNLVSRPPSPALPVRSTNTPAPPVVTLKTNLPPGGGLHAPRNPFEAQIALARLGYSSGPIDGSPGSQTRAALRAWQERNRLPVTGDLDAPTRARLLVEEPVLTTFIVTAEDVARLRPLGKGWLEKSEQKALDYESIAELAAERFRCAEGLLRALNPGVVWTNPAPGMTLKVPNTYPPDIPEKAAFVRIHLAGKTLQAFDARTNIIAHFPCSIAQRVEKRPVGRLTVTKAVANPNYLFNPEIFPESNEAQAVGRKLVIPPGPNNPVGTAWISLDRPGYGIHGTPKPEQVGRTESHGCFRLANWNAEHLLKLVWVGMPVFVDP